jgi:methyl-accepting chemotaxis protein
MKLRNRIFLTFLLSTVLPLILLTAMTGWMGTTRLRSLYKTLMAAEADNRAQILAVNRLRLEQENRIALESWLKGLADSLWFYCQETWKLQESGILSRAEAEKRITTAILSVRIQKTGYAFGMNSAGVLVIHPKSPGRDLSGEKHIKEMMDKKEGVIRYTAVTTGQEKIVVYRWFEPMDLIIAPGVNTEEMIFLYDRGLEHSMQQEEERNIAAATIGRTGYLALLSRDGKVLTAGETADKSGLETLAARVFPVTGRRMLTPAASGMDAEVLLLQLPPDGRVLAAVLPEREIMGAVAQLLLPMVLITIVLLLMILVVGNLTARSIARPVRLITDQLTRLAAGNADLTLRFTARSHDEIGELSNQFNIFLESLHADIAQILESARKFSSFATDISSSSRNLSKESLLQAGQMSSILVQFDKFSRNLETINSNLDRQFKTAENNNRLISEVTEETKRIGSEIGDLEQSTRTSVAHLDNSHEMMRRTETGIGDMTLSMKEMQTRIDQVKQHSDSIGSILGVIEDISERTNLLAMNAAIEAAHAGESGKGFAVVAGEIKKLAENTQRAVKEVRDMISAIRQSVDQTLDSVKTGNLRAGEIRQYAAETSALFGHLREGILGTSQLIGGLRAVFNQLGLASEEIRGSTEEVSRLTSGSRDIILQQKEGYTGIQGIIGISTQKSEEYAQSSQSLAELGIYLKVGESELLRIVQNYIIDTAKIINSDKRNENRSHILYNLEVRDSSLTRVAGYLGNISASGFQLLAVEAFNRGDIHEFNIQPPFVFTDSSKMIRVTAECRWVSDNRKSEYIQTGFKITSIEPEHRRKYQELFTELSLGSWSQTTDGSLSNDDAEQVEEL